MFSRDIINSLALYANNLKGELEVHEKNSIKQHNRISHRLKAIINTNPHLITQLNLNGGAPLSPGKIQKINDITALFTYFQQLDPTVLHTKSVELEAKLDEILLLIDDIKKVDMSNIANIVSPDRLLQNVEAIKVSVTDFARGYKVYPQRVALSTPVDVNPARITPIDKSIITGIETALTKEIDDYKKAMSTSSTFNNANFTRLVTQLNAHVTKIDEEIVKLNEALRNLNDFEKKFMVQIDGAIKHSNISKIPNVPSLHVMIKSSDVDSEFKTRMENAFQAIKDDKYRDYVDTYNSYILTVVDRKGLPEQYFDGRYTKRINNNLLVNSFDIRTKLKTVKDMLVIADSELNYNDNLALKGMYDPDFKNLGSMAGGYDSHHASGPVRVVRSGATTPNPAIQLPTVSIVDAETKVTETDDKIRKYTKLMSEYNKRVKTYNRIIVNNLTHTLFLLLIVTNQIFTSGYVVFKYVNKGLIEFYKRVLNNIHKKIETKNTSDEILYLKKYHLVTIMKLKSFLDSLSPILNPSDVVDIEKCTDKAVNGFLLMNYFKDILGSYNEMFQNKITIYSRINDIRYKFDAKTDPENFQRKKMFISDYERKDFYNVKRELKGTEGTGFNLDADVDPQIMWIRSEACKRLPDTIEKLTNVKFTEVFDTANFPLNGDISKYMTLDTQLSKGKGVAVVTYGYSGTGKTYTLFGNRDEGKEGVLQATLDNISSLKYIKFRLYEIYGLGLPYPNYWTDESTKKGRLDSIYNYVYKYNLGFAADGLGFTNVDEFTSTKIGEFVKNNLLNVDGSKNETYTTIPGDIASEVFRNFDGFIKKVENYREGKDQSGKYRRDGKPRRIRDTPNNIVSSRSVLIYDFMLGLEGVTKDVPFLIIDLPGREEITQTYVKPYIENTQILNALRFSKSSNFDEYISELTLFLTSMSLNPLAISIFNPTLILDVFKKEDMKIKLWEIFNADMNLVFEVNNSSIDGYQTVMENGIHKITGVIDSVSGEVRGFKIWDEIINAKGTPITTFITFDPVNKTFGVGNKKGFGYSRSDDKQYLSLLCIHLMNRLITLNKFDIIEVIYKTMVDNMINRHLNTYVESLSQDELKHFVEELKEENFKGELLKNLPTSYTASDVKQAISYDYYLTGFEGIYINENIIGLIKFLAAKMITEPVKQAEFLNKKIRRQPDNLNFQYQQKVARVWLMSDEKSDRINDFYNFKREDKIPKRLFMSDLSYNKTNVDSECEILSNNYKSDKIFNFDNPLITDILEPYLSEINDYKVFYLFGNYGDDNIRELKCAHQFNLFKNTEDFIQTITE